MNVAALTRDLVSIPSHEDETVAGTSSRDGSATRPKPPSSETSTATSSRAWVRARRRSRSLVTTTWSRRTTRRSPGMGSTSWRRKTVVSTAGDGRHEGLRRCGDVCATRRRPRRPLDCELVFVSFVAEESGCLGSEAAVEDGFAPDYAVVGEGSTGYSADGVTDVAVAHTRAAGEYHHRPRDRRPRQRT